VTKLAQQPRQAGILPDVGHDSTAIE
jgi:hypothetical protein